MHADWTVSVPEQEHCRITSASVRHVDGYTLRSGPTGSLLPCQTAEARWELLGLLVRYVRNESGEVEENWQARGSFAGSYFNEAMDSLLSRMPHLHALHLGNNQLDARQAEGLAATFLRHKMNCLENLTLGSNDIGDTGLSAILKALPPCMKQLYLHGIDCTDTGVMHLREAVEKWPELWGLGKHRDLQHV
jgi:hypothetical protein